MYKVMCAGLATVILLGIVVCSILQLRGCGNGRQSAQLAQNHDILSEFIARGVASKLEVASDKTTVFDEFVSLFASESKVASVRPVNSYNRAQSNPWGISIDYYYKDGHILREGVTLTPDVKYSDQDYLIVRRGNFSQRINLSEEQSGRLFVSYFGE